MKMLRLLPLAAAIGLATGGPAHAESLLQMYEAARAYDATWQSAKAQYDANLYRAEQAKAGILPQAALTAGASRSTLDVDNPPTDRAFGTQNATISASQPLYRPANLATYRQGRRQLLGVLEGVFSRYTAASTAEVLAIGLLVLLLLVRPAGLRGKVEEVRR
jgi:outer membrane protein